MYDKSIKNKEKIEFQFANNRNCFDYKIETPIGVILRGSMTPIGSEDYQETYNDFRNLPYSKKEFEKISKNLTHRFLNYKNKKKYEEDTTIYSTDVELWNSEKDEPELLLWELNLTYCP